MKRYKVVKQSTSWPKEYFSDGIIFMPTKSKYRLKYKVGKITKAVEESLGIFCFKTIADAKRFAIYGEDLIFEVNSIGRGKVPLIIANFFYVKEFYSEDIYKTNKVPKVLYVILL